MDEATRKRYFSVLSNRDVGIEFPTPKQRVPAQTFEVGDGVIVTTSCEDIGLHGLTGKVSSIARTGSYIVQLDVDDSKLPFLPHEIGHRF